jgi:predicted GNAT family acetyltransferase
MSEPTVVDAAERKRFEISVDGELAGFAEYHRGHGTIAFTHTEIEPVHEGEGLGTRLIVAALDAARADGAGVLPFCPFVRKYIADHREYLDLVPEARRGEFDLGG